ncbi:MAG: VOC family protein [Phycisphaerales bacterium]
MPRGELQFLRPMLAVRDLPATVRFYVEKLGFNCNSMFGNPPVWCDLDRDGVSIMFNAPPREGIERDVPRSARNYQIFYFNCPDAAALREEFLARGVAASDLRVTNYGMKEFEVRDPDDYWLWFGQPTDEPPMVSE